MKICNYCGSENRDTAAACAGCGTTEFKGIAASATEPPAEIGLREILTDPVRLFRALVVGSLIIYLIWFFEFLLFGKLISREMYNGLSWGGYGALGEMPRIFYWLSMAVFIAVAFGMWRFSKAARLAFTLFMAFYATVVPLVSGLYVQTPFGAFLGQLTHLADGATLVLAYTSPLKEKFA